MNPLILIIDDDEKLNRLLSDYLNDFGYRTLTAAHPEAGLKKLKEESPNLLKPSGVQGMYLSGRTNEW